MKKLTVPFYQKPLTYIYLVSVILGLVLWGESTYRTVASLWEPFVPERLTMELPIGEATLLNRPGPAEFTEIRVQAPTVITVASREFFLERATEAERVEAAFTLGEVTLLVFPEVAKQHDIYLRYAAHGKETTYLWSETVSGRSGQGVRGDVDLESFALEGSRTLSWKTVRFDSDTLFLSSVGLTLWLLIKLAATAFTAHAIAFVVWMIIQNWKPRPDAPAPA